VWNLQKIISSNKGGMLKFTYKGRFLTIKIAYTKVFEWESERWEHVVVPFLYVEIFIFEKYWNLDCWWNFKASSLTRFWQFRQFRAVSGKFCYIGNGWQHAQILLVAAHCKATISFSLHLKSQVHDADYCISRNLLKSAKSHFGSLGCLEVNVETHHFRGNTK
jgi:hypothetical protein